MSEFEPIKHDDEYDRYDKLPGFQVSNRYKVDCVAGSGTFGHVVKAHVKSTAGKITIKRVAIKKVLLKKSTGSIQNSSDANVAVISKRACRELGVLYLHNHSKLIELFDVYIAEYKNGNSVITSIYFVTEYMNYSLKEFLDMNVNLDHPRISSFIYQILVGLKHLKKMKVIHRDLKPGNILIDANWQLKICDFGLSRDLIDGTMTSEVVTKQYRAPEIVLGLKYGSKADIWSLGCIFVQLFTKEIFLPSGTYEDPLIIILKKVGNPSNEYIEKLKEKARKEKDKPRKELKEKVLDRLKKKRVSGDINITRTLKKLLPDGVPENSMLPSLNTQMARQLIENMLQIEPDKRCEINEALEHVYVKSCWNELEININPKEIYIPPTFDSDSNLWQDQLYKKVQEYQEKLRGSANVVQPGPSTSSTQPETLYSPSEESSNWELPSSIDALSLNAFSTITIQGSEFKLLERYIDTSEISYGSFGRVCKAYDDIDRKWVTIKKLQIDEYLYDAKYANYKRLASSESHVHLNFIQLLNVYTPDITSDSFNELYMVIEYMERSLHDLIQSHTQFSHQNLSFIVGQLLFAVNYLDNMGIVHGSLKPKNIFIVDSNFRLKITDYGILFEPSEQERLLKVHGYEYLAPETMFHVKCDHKADIWCIGCIFVELLLNYPIFRGDGNKVQWEKIVEFVGNPTKSFLNRLKESDRKWMEERLEKYPPIFDEILSYDRFPPKEDILKAKMALDLIRRMLKIDAIERFSVKEAIEHPYLLECLYFEELMFEYINNVSINVNVIGDNDRKYNDQLFSQVQEFKP